MLEVVLNLMILIENTQAPIFWQVCITIQILILTCLYLNACKSRITTPWKERTVIKEQYTCLCSCIMFQPISFLNIWLDVRKSTSSYKRWFLKRTGYAKILNHTISFFKSVDSLIYTLPCFLLWLKVHVYALYFSR